MERGVRRLEIFQDDFDKMVFLEILKDELSKNGCKLHAYCLMSNHFHFLLETHSGARPVRPAKGASPSRRKSCTKRE